MPSCCMKGREKGIRLMLSPLHSGCCSNVTAECSPGRYRGREMSANREFQETARVQNRGTRSFAARRWLPSAAPKDRQDDSVGAGFLRIAQSRSAGHGSRVRQGKAGRGDRITRSFAARRWLRMTSARRLVQDDSVSGSCAADRREGWRRMAMYGCARDDKAGLDGGDSW